MAQLLRRIFKAAWQGFVRNGWLSVATIIVMILSILIFSGVLMLNTAFGMAIKTLKEKVDISVYFKAYTPEEDILKIKDEVSGLKEVARVDYISQQQALAIFTEQRKSDPLITKALQELGENPLSASLNIKAKSTNDYPTIVSYIDSSTFKDKLLSVDLADNQKVITRLNSLGKGLQAGTLLLDIVLSLVAIIVAFNTIRMAIFALREEVTIMKLAGASNWFIRGPFLVNGMLCGVIAAFATLILFIPIVLWLGPKAAAFVSGFNMIGYFFSHLGLILLWQLLFGIIIGVVSSFIAITKYLKV